MPPRENQFVSRGTGSSVPPVRQISSVDGIGPRTLQRSAPIRASGSRPFLARAPRAFERPPTFDVRPAGPVSQPAVAAPAPTPIIPTASVQMPLAPPENPLAPLQQPISAPPTADNDDSWLPKLAGQTPVTSVAPKATLSSPSPAVTSPVRPVEPKADLDAPNKPSKKTRAVSHAKRLAKGTKNRITKRVLIRAGIAASIVLIGFGIFAGIQYTRNQASPDTVFADALTNALQTKQVRITEQDSGRTSIATLDMTQPKNIRISANAATLIAGNPVQVNTYGTPQNTYFTYTQLPDALASASQTTYKNHWIQLRESGILPAGINANLVNLADPRYQALGPVLFANLPAATGTKLAKFIVTNKVYGYSLPQVHKVTLNGKHDLLYSGKLKSDYLKIAVQSAATNEGFSIDSVQRAADAQGSYSQANVSLYIDGGKRQIDRLVVSNNGQTTIYDYTGYNSVTVPAQPTAPVNWPHFAPLQLALESQLSQLQTSDARDQLRQADLMYLQTAINQYYAQNNVYPSLDNLNDQSWIATNLPDFDPDTTRDPGSGILALLASPQPVAKTTTSTGKTGNAAKTVVTTPATQYGYVYQPSTSTGKVCANATTTPAAGQCAKYVLTATLSSGKAYVVQSS